MLRNVYNARGQKQNKQQYDIKEKAFRDRKKNTICFKDVCMGIIQPVWKEKKICVSNLIKQNYTKKRKEFGFYFKEKNKKRRIFSCL